jgi:ADP-ribose pyrophosphatase YjhB (NUDIX family)
MRGLRLGNIGDDKERLETVIIPKRTYQKIQSLVPIVCVDIICIHNQHVLFAKRAEEPLKDKWFLPGGRLYYGETLEECAVRKAKEECGLTGLLLGSMVHFQQIQYPDRHNICFCYTMHSGQHNVALDATASDYTWIFYKDIGSDHIANEYVENCLRGANLL